MFEEELGLLKSVPWGWYVVVAFVVAIWINNDLMLIVSGIILAVIIYGKFFKNKKEGGEYGGHAS